MAARGTYEAAFQSPTFGPGGMHDPVGNAYWGSIGKVIDDQIAKMKLAVRMSGPKGALALGATDALDELAHDRMLPRGGTTPAGTEETDAALAARLDQAWDIWAKAGTPWGVLQQLSDAGFPVKPSSAETFGSEGAFIVNHTGIMSGLRCDGTFQYEAATGNGCVSRTQLDGTLPVSPLFGWTLDARNQFYSRWILLFLWDVPTLLNDVGDPVKACLNQICSRWNELGAHYDGCAIVPTEDSAKCWGWPLTVKWGDQDLVWGSNNARFIDPE